MAEKTSYKQILKATSLFGGVQFIGLFGSILKTKVAALLIGVSGVGVFGVLNSTLSFILALTRCGLDLTAVREIASGTKEDVPKKVNLVERLILFTGLVGTVVFLMLSPWLSQLAFSNRTYTLFFVTISIAVLFNQLAIGNMAILQGVKSLKRLAKVIAFSSLASLIPTVCIYYFFGENGVPWVIVVTAIISYIISKYYVDKLKIKKYALSLSTLMVQGKSVLKSGFYLSLANIISLSVGFIVQIFITNTGGIEQAGLYSAGYVIINSYVAVFFSALSKDFFPRLTEVSKSKELVTKTVNEQAYMLLLMLTPLILIFLVLKPFIVALLYSKEFLPILGMITYGIVGTAFNAVSWSMGFIMIAKGDSKLYLITEFVSNGMMVLAILVGYHLGGLTGLGIGFLMYHIFDFLYIKFIVAKKYKFYFNSSFNKLFYLCIFQFLIMLCLFYLESDMIKYTIMAVIVLLSLSISLIKLNDIFDLKSILKETLGHNNKKR